MTGVPCLVSCLSHPCLLIFMSTQSHSLPTVLRLCFPSSRSHFNMAQQKQAWRKSHSRQENDVLSITETSLKYYLEPGQWCHHWLPGHKSQAIFIISFFWTVRQRGCSRRLEEFVGEIWLSSWYGWNRMDRPVRRISRWHCQAQGDLCWNVDFNKSTALQG